MKPRSRSVLPPPGSPARLPIAATAALALIAIAQLTLADAVALPAAGPVARIGLDGSVLPPPPVAPVARDAVRAMFAPSAAGFGTALATAGVAPADPLAGMTLAGTIRIGRAAYAVVRGPGGAIRNVGLGGSIAGWRLVALSPFAAQLARGSRRITIPFGAAAAAPPEAPSEEAQ